MVARVMTPIKGSRRIAVISRKGGVGRTTTALMLGHTLASWRRGGVVALDCDTDAGDLGYRIGREHGVTLTDLVEDAPSLRGYEDLRSYTSRAPSGLEVVAADDPRIIRPSGEEEYASAIQLLGEYYDLILLDTGTGTFDSATQVILGMVDQVIIVTTPGLDGARGAGLTIDWLGQNGAHPLVRSAIAVVNRHQEGTPASAEERCKHACRATVTVPYDPHLEAGAQSELSQLKQATRDAYLQLAAAVAGCFTQRCDRASGRAGSAGSVTAETAQR
jgi:putative peptide zinc metalloprotease protein